MRLVDQVAVVTGAGQGIGRAIALAYAREGARVVVAEIKASRMERTVAEITGAGGTAMGIEVDTGVHASVKHMVAAAVDAYGRLDVLVNNAQGFAPRTPLEHVDDEQFDRVFATGAKGSLWAMQAAFSLAVFLASAESRYLTGHTFYADGGAHISPV